jgi:Na+-transporting NADH:ubiquinone oxidoreductase subunit NqrF
LPSLCLEPIVTFLCKCVHSVEKIGVIDFKTLFHQRCLQLLAMILTSKKTLVSTVKNIKPPIEVDLQEMLTVPAYQKDVIMLVIQIVSKESRFLQSNK